MGYFGVFLGYFALFRFLSYAIAWFLGTWWFWLGCGFLLRLGYLDLGLGFDLGVFFYAFVLRLCCLFVIWMCSLGGLAFGFPFAI